MDTQAGNENKGKWGGAINEKWGELKWELWADKVN